MYAAFNIVSSSKCFPIICIPIGIPSWLSPHGIDIAGTPATLIGTVQRSSIYNSNGLFVFDTNKTAEELEETLILNDVDVLDVSVEDGKAEVLVTDEAFENAKKVLNDDGINDFDVAEVRFIPNEKITLEGEDLKKFNDLLDSLDDCEDVQAVYHNVER